MLLFSSNSCPENNSKRTQTIFYFHRINETLQLLIKLIVLVGMHNISTIFHFSQSDLDFFQNNEDRQILPNELQKSFDLNKDTYFLLCCAINFQSDKEKCSHFKAIFYLNNEFFFDR